MFHCPVTQSASSDKIRNSRKLLDKFRARPNTELSEMNQFTQSKSTMHYEKATLNVHNVSLRQMADAKNTELGWHLPADKTWQSVTVDCVGVGRVAVQVINGTDNIT